MSATVEAIREMADLRSLVEETVQLHRQGNRWIAACPFHEERTPSFVVNEKLGLWKCFGAGCGKGGDVFTWIMEREHCTFPEAVHYLCQRYGISTPQWTPEQQREYEIKREVERLLTEISAAYQREYRNSPGAEYMRGRGIPDEVAIWWGIGYAENAKHAASSCKHYPKEVVQAAGVLETNGMFEKRIIIPMVRGGRTVNLYGRTVLPPEHFSDPDAYNATKHRYLKGRVRTIFGLDEAGEDTVIVEGAMDALSVIAAGYKAIAVGGVATEEQHDLIKRYTEGMIYIAMDADQKAEKGPLAALKMAALLARSPNGRTSRIVDWGLAGPFKDANEILASHGPGRVRDCLTENVPPLIYRASKDLDTKFDGCLLVQDGSSLRAELADRRTYVIEGMDNKSDPKGIRASIRLLMGRDTLNVDNVGLFSSIQRNRYVNGIMTNLRRVKPNIEVKATEAALHGELLVIEQELRRWEAELQGRDADAETDEDPDRPAMTDEEREEALSLLQNPYMLQEVINDAHTLGVVGEDPGILMTWLTMTSRILPDPLYLCFKGESSVGKSFLLKTVSDLCPPEDVRQFTRITPQALFWTEDPKTYLKHKFLIVSERPGGEGADYSIRTMLSEKGLTMFAPEKVDNRIVSKERVIDGPMAYAETTTALSIHNENETRLLEIYLDETVHQTDEIHTRQRWEFSLDGRIHEIDRTNIMQKHRNAQRLLRPVEIVIPYAEMLTFPNMRPRTRRDQKKFLNLICVIAFAHQYRKEVKTLRRGSEAIEYIEADIEDYAVAYELSKAIFSVSLDELDKRSRELFTRIIDHVEKEWHRRNVPVNQTSMDEEPKTPSAQDLMDIGFTRRELTEATGWSNHAVNTILTYLVDMELIRTPGGRPGQTFTYFVQFIPSSNAQSDLERCLISPDRLAEMISSQGKEDAHGRMD